MIYRRASLCLTVAAWLFRVSLLPAAIEPLLLGDGDRLLFFAPHPGDESMAGGGLIQEAVLQDIPVRVCFFTMGENHETAALFTRRHPVQLPRAFRSMGQRRYREALAAATSLGLASDQLTFLGFPDTDTLNIWETHWRETPPLRSRLTRSTTVPYDWALTPATPHAGEDILDDLEEVLLDFRPTWVALPHPADHNPDHRALHLFLRVALWNLESAGITPELLAYPVHFTQWPEPLRLLPDLPAFPPFFLRDESSWRQFELAPFQITNKFAALRRHHSQSHDMPLYASAFTRKTELFSASPPIPLPEGRGRFTRLEEDSSRFLADDRRLEQLAGDPDLWTAIAAQHQAEAAAIAGHERTFVSQSVSGDGRHLSLEWEFSEPLAPETSLILHLFGYRTDTRFGDMPKIRVEIRQGQVVSATDLHVSLPSDVMYLAPSAPDEIIARISFGSLGHPEKVLLGAQLSHGPIPLDWLPWLVLDLNPADIEVLPVLEEPIPPAAQTPPTPVPPPGPSADATPSPLPAPADTLTPRVRLPTRTLPERNEANQPVYW